MRYSPKEYRIYHTLANILTKGYKQRTKEGNIDISVDGGINDKNALNAVKAGANILVSGNYIFKSKNPKAAIELLRRTNI